jgi:hypothetical protein
LPSRLFADLDPLALFVWFLSILRTQGIDLYDWQVAFRSKDFYVGNQLRGVQLARSRLPLE